MARLKLKIIPLLDKVFIYSSLLSFLQSWRWGVLGALPALQMDLSYGPAELFCVDAYMEQFSSLMLSLLPWIVHCTRVCCGPQWRSQMRRGRTLATQFWKRITGFGKSGIGYHIPPGCGKEEQLRLS